MHVRVCLAFTMCLEENKVFTIFTGVVSLASSSENLTHPLLNVGGEH